MNRSLLNSRSAHGPSPARSGARAGLGFALAALIATGVGAGAASARVRVAASTNDLASIASAVGGDQVEVVSISRPNADPHRVEVLPSYMVRVSRAQLYLKVGLSLDQWADQIIDGSHNGDLVIVDCSKGVPVLEKPTGKVDASMGDVHPEGNPHYWLDPRNGGIVAHTVAEALSRVDPAHAGDYAARADQLEKAANELQARGVQTLATLTSHDIITYHRSWTYFANAFGLNVVSTIEPIPGIPPTGKHLQDLVTVIQQRKVPLAIEEPYFSEDAGEFLNRQTGIRVARVSAACSDTAAGSYLSHFEDLLAILANKNAAASLVPVH
jgi:zinc/manganese transport system substrate-binding protein